MPVLKNFLGLSSVNESGKKNDNQGTSKKITQKLDLLDKKMDGLYKDIYISRPDNKQNLDDIFDNIDIAIDRLNGSENSVSGMSELLRRITDKNNVGGKELLKSVGDLFSDNGLMDSLFANESIHKYIAAQNYQYDMICRYLPKLSDALEIKRDNVLCSDNFSKKFINAKSTKTNKEDSNKFSSNCARLETEYELDDFFDKTYMNVLKYGEDFIYVVPYTVAFKRLIDRTNLARNTGKLGQLSFYESVSGKRGNESVSCVAESFTTTEDYKNYINTLKKDNYSVSENSKFKGYEVNLHFNHSNAILDSVNEMCVLKNKSDSEKLRSLSSVYESSLSESYDITGDISKQLEELKNQNDKISSAKSNDGLIIPAELNRDSSKIDKNINGAVLERLPRENVIPIYIGKKCLGYYYFEFKENSNACGYCGGEHSTPSIGNSSKYSYQMSEEQQELAIRYIASRISTNIDTHFINANKDLKEEIYAILNYNEKFNIGRRNDISVTFLPAEDVVHCYTKFDEVTHRGVSALQKSVVPAMLYILLYLTDIIGKITRSTDKRIYYVKQNVETNVARTMMNVVQQIKKGNMGMRQIESMNNILNIVGKYNDYIIPLGQSGVA